MDLKCIFDVENIEKSALSINLNARQIHLNLTRLKEDYLQVKSMESKIDALENKKEKISNQINSLIKMTNDKTKIKSIQQSKEFQQLVHQANEIKNKINQILEDLIPLQEIVLIACLRLPNSLHVSSLLVYTLKINNKLDILFSNKQNDICEEDNKSIELFRLNHQKLGT